MKDTMKPCQHSLSDDMIYKDVVIIGNGPSGMVTSYMLAGNVPYLKRIPDDLPIDEMLKARLSNLPPGQSLYETDLLELAEGLEGRSHNPIPLLMDNLLRPCADIGMQADSLIEWKFDSDKQIDHIVLGRGPVGGAWHTFGSGVRTLSPGAWLSLPPHRAPAPQDTARVSARAVAKYCRLYVHATNIQKYFRNGVIVTRVVTMSPPTEMPCCKTCPLHAAFCVYGYEPSSGLSFRYACRRVVVAAGGSGKPNTLRPDIAPHCLHQLAHLERAVRNLRAQDTRYVGALIVGSGASGADGVSACLTGTSGTDTGGTNGTVPPVHHAYRSGARALAALPQHAYPDYCQVYKMMCDGKSEEYPNYVAHPDHVILDVEVIDDGTYYDDYTYRLKRVTLLDVTTNQTKEITVNIIAVLIGSKPDLFFLQTSSNKENLTSDTKKRKMEKDQQNCSLKNHWHYLKTVLGQSIKNCKSRYLNYTEINGNSETKCSDCDIEIEKDCKCEVIPYELDSKVKCVCDRYSNGIGLGIDPDQPVDGRNNPIAIDKGSHELLNGPNGLYALGPLTGDNFVRFIPGGALAIVSHIHKQNDIE